MTDIYQIEPSYDDLAFEPKCRTNKIVGQEIEEMSWKEFVEFAKDYNLKVKEYGFNACVTNGMIAFFYNGEIMISSPYGGRYISFRRSYYQMKVIIENMLDRIKKMDEVTEDMIGCLCWFNNYREIVVGILKEIQIAPHGVKHYLDDNGYFYPECRPVKPEDIKFYKDSNNGKDC